MIKKVRKAVIPVAGDGSRFLPGTKATPKEMFPIIDTPTIQLIVEECVASGIEEILFITSPHKKIILDHFDKSYELEKRFEERGKTEELEIILRARLIRAVGEENQAKADSLVQDIRYDYTMVGYCYRALALMLEKGLITADNLDTVDTLFRGNTYALMKEYILVDKYMEGTVHRFDVVVAFIHFHGSIHVFIIEAKMTGSFP